MADADCLGKQRAGFGALLASSRTVVRIPHSGRFGMGSDRRFQDPQIAHYHLLGRRLHGPEPANDLLAERRQFGALVGLIGGSSSRKSPLAAMDSAVLGRDAPDTGGGKIVAERTEVGAYVRVGNNASVDRVVIDDALGSGVPG